MMLFRFLTRPKAILQVQTPETCLPGSTVDVVASLRTKERVYSRQLKIELLGRETWYERVTTSSGKGVTHTYVVKRDETFSRVPVTLSEQTTPYHGSERWWKTSLSVPADASPSAKGSVVHVRWLIRATLDVSGRRNVSAEKPIQVLSPILSFAHESSRPAATRGFEECVLSLEMPQVSVACRQTVQGTLRMEILNSFEVRAIRVELVRVEDAKARSADEVVALDKISGPASLDPYESPARYSFALAVPPDAAPTTSSPRSSLQWKVRTVLDRPLRTDFAVEQGLMVSAGREAQ